MIEAESYNVEMYEPAQQPRSKYRYPDCGLAMVGKGRRTRLPDYIGIGDTRANRYCHCGHQGVHHGDECHHQDRREGDEAQLPSTGTQ